MWEYREERTFIIIFFFSFVLLTNAPYVLQISIVVVVVVVVVYHIADVIEAQKTVIELVDASFLFFDYENADDKLDVDAAGDPLVRRFASLILSNVIICERNRIKHLFLGDPFGFRAGLGNGNWGSTRRRRRRRRS